MFSGAASISQFNRKNILIWFSMAFQGGAINAGGFLACHRFVSHTTGFATNFGTEISQGNMRAAFGFLTVPIFFLLGSMTSAFFVDRRLATGNTPRYDFMFGLITVAMLYVAIGGTLGVFGVFGEPTNIDMDYFLLAILCLCSGVQNATITSASGAVVRTTHLTGITTDLGIGLIRVFTTGRKEAFREHETRANWMRVGIVASFISGSALAAFVFMKLQYWGFLGPALISATLMITTIWKRRELKKASPPQVQAS